MPQCAPVCPSVPQCAPVCPSVPQCAPVCPSVPQCAPAWLCHYAQVNTFHSRILQYGVQGSTVPQLPTHNLSILLTPGSSRGVCTNCPPYSIATHLYPAHISLCNRLCLNKPHRIGAGVLSCRNSNRLKSSAQVVNRGIAR